MPPSPAQPPPITPPPQTPPPQSPAPPFSPPPPLNPCIGQGVTFDFQYTYVLHSNLGGKGPDTSAPPTIRFVNVASFALPSPNGAFVSTYVDLEVSARSDYTPYDAALNTLHGKFAQINVKANTQVDLRVTMVRSCATEPSCVACTQPGMTTYQKVTCFATGCACYGTTVYAEADCSGNASAVAKESYNCPLVNQPVVFPRESMVSMTVYDFDRGPNMDYTEQLKLPVYEYFATPLRAASGSTSITSTVFVNEADKLFTSTARGDASDNPTDPKTLTDEQASKGRSE